MDSPLHIHQLWFTTYVHPFGLATSAWSSSPQSFWPLQHDHGGLKFTTLGFITFRFTTLYSPFLDSPKKTVNLSKRTLNSPISSCIAQWTKKIVNSPFVFNFHDSIFFDEKFRGRGLKRFWAFRNPSWQSYRLVSNVYCDLIFVSWKKRFWLAFIDFQMCLKAQKKDYI